MGFWSTLVRGAVDVGHIIVNNSGSIFNAAKVIASVARAIPITEVVLFAEGEDDNLLPKLHKELEQAADKILQEAIALAPAPVIPNNDLGNASDVTRRGPIDLPGFWPLPPGSGNQKIPPAVAVDVNKFLGLQRFPHTHGEGGNTVDLGELIAQQMFAKANDPKPKPGVNFTLLKITAGDGTLLTGAHVYYRVPLGDRNSQDGWHSHLRLWMLQTTKDRTKWEEDQKNLAIQPLDSQIDLEAPYNSSTISVQWNGVRGVGGVMTKSVNKLLADNRYIKFLPPKVVDGPRHTYQFKTTTNIGPAEVVSAFSSAISDVLNPPSDTHPMPRMPVISLENTATFLP